MARYVNAHPDPRNPKGDIQNLPWVMQAIDSDQLICLATVTIRVGSKFRVIRRAIRVWRDVRTVPETSIKRKGRYRCPHPLFHHRKQAHLRWQETSPVA